MHLSTILHSIVTLLTDTDTFQAVVYFEAELFVGYFTSVEPIAIILRHFVHSEFAI